MVVTGMVVTGMVVTGMVQLFESIFNSPLVNFEQKKNMNIGEYKRKSTFSLPPVNLIYLFIKTMDLNNFFSKRIYEGKRFQPYINVLQIPFRFLELLR